MSHANAPAAEPIVALFDGSLQDPFPAYAELRETRDGVHFAESLGGYLVTRYEDVRRISMNPRVFSSDKFTTIAASHHNAADSEQRRFVRSASQLFMFKDPPEHTRIRSTFRHVFTPHAIAEWRSTVARMTGELLSRHPRGEELDVMPTLAADVPVAVIAAILGVPPEHRPKFREWSHAYASTFDPVVQGARRDHAITTSLELYDYLAGLIAERRAMPQDDLISTLVRTVPSDGAPLTDAELVPQVALLLVAGNETTTTMIGSAISIVLEHPELRRSMTADPSLTPIAIEEMLRLEPPLHLVSRKTTKEVEIGEHTVPADMLVYLCPPAANRDPRRFDEPDTFRLGREDNKHLAFLHGLHFCVGAPLARLEVQIVLDYLLRTYPTMRAGKAPAVRASENVVARGWKSRPVIL